MTPQANSFKKILELLTLAERLKFELRHSWLSNGRRESVAEHTWRVALMAILLHRRVKHPVNIEKALKMAIIHDLVEAEAGDVPVHEISARKEKKAEREKAAILKIRDILQDDVGEEIFSLWNELEEKHSNEARFVNALDKLEAQIQHNEADIATWIDVEYEMVFNAYDKHCKYDPIMLSFCQEIKKAGIEKMKQAGVNVQDIEKKAQVTN